MNLLRYTVHQNCPELLRQVQDKTVRIQLEIEFSALRSLRILQATVVAMTRAFKDLIKRFS